MIFVMYPDIYEIKATNVTWIKYESIAIKAILPGITQTITFFYRKDQK